jgi:hypothetical protein
MHSIRSRMAKKFREGKKEESTVSFVVLHWPVFQLGGQY